MKKNTICLALLLLLVSSGVTGLFAQSLENNEYYALSVKYAELSEEALNNGEYDLSTEYAQLSQEFAAMSREYIERMLVIYRARSAYVAAKSRMEQADQLHLDRRNADLYAEVAPIYQDAVAAFDAESYGESIPDFRRVTELLRDFESNLPPEINSRYAAFYEVKLNLDRRDCLWNIAGFDFIYGDSFQWRRIYEANRESFPDPNNPNWIEPGMILKIPSIRGEERAGTR
ncbi:hypothetical protein FACS189493_1740 [Spirochaetia bacterium]|nr:hypothetical protein FACS189493_1740 [Spirochaetia bacterium]